MERARKIFIPMNDLPNESELLNGFMYDVATGEKIVEGLMHGSGDRVEERRTRGQDGDGVPETTPMQPSTVPGTQPYAPSIPGTPGPGGQYGMKQPGGGINEIDFVWGMFFFDSPSVFVDRNRIFFQGEIYRESVTQVKQTIIELGKTLTQRYYDIGIYDPSLMSIELWINSPGGAVSAGFSLIDFMNNFHIPINTVGTGTVASMAVLLLLAGKSKALTTNANLLVHQLRAGIQGRLDEMLDYMKHLDSMHKQMTDYIVRHTHLDAKKVADLLARESWIMAPEALKMGFVDRVIS